jgi:hypothetical protein
MRGLFKTTINIAAMLYAIRGGIFLATFIWQNKHNMTSHVTSLANVTTFNRNSPNSHGKHERN